jgi:hypothetical protein
MLHAMAEESGRWVRIPGSLRAELAEASAQIAHPALISVLALYDRARPEDWIAQLVEVNRELSEMNRELHEEIRRMQALSPISNPRRQTA